MFVDDIEWAKFVYFSPNFLKNESQFKGAWRDSRPMGEYPILEGYSANFQQLSM